MLKTKYRLKCLYYHHHFPLCVLGSSCSGLYILCTTTGTQADDLVLIHCTSRSHDEHTFNEHGARITNACP